VVSLGGAVAATAITEVRRCSSNTNRQYFNRVKVLLMNITEQEYEDVLEEAPDDHLSQEFVDWLRATNIVHKDIEGWLVVKNIKYHKEDRPWLTAFDLLPEMTLEYKIQLLQWEYPEYKMIIHPKIIRSIKRFHIHLIKADREYRV